MKVLVTGASGHVGGAIAKHLAQQGNEVVALNRKYARTLPENVEQIVATLGAADFDNMIAKVGGLDAVVHAAAYLGSEIENEELSRTNCLGTQQLLYAAQESGATCFINISSVAVYGLPISLPITEKHPLNPTSPYAASKLYGEQLLHLAALRKMRTVSLRISSPVGPGLKYRRIFRIFVRNALSNLPIVLDGAGNRRQNYVDVRDVAKAVEQVSTSDAEGIYNVTGARTVSNVELAEACVKCLGSDSEISFSGRPDPDEGVCWDISIEKAQAAWGYSPAYSLEDSIEALAEELRGEE